MPRVSGPGYPHLCMTSLMCFDDCLCKVCLAVLHAVHDVASFSLTLLDHGGSLGRTQRINPLSLDWAMGIPSHHLAMFQYRTSTLLIPDSDSENDQPPRRGPIPHGLELWVALLHPVA